MLFDRLKEKIMEACGRKKDPDEREALLGEIRAVKRDMLSTESLYNNEKDPYITEYCIYQQKALEARFGFLLECLRRFRADKDPSREESAEQPEKEESGCNEF